MSGTLFSTLPRKTFRMRLALILAPIAWISLLGVGIAGFTSVNPLAPVSVSGGRWDPLRAPFSFYSIYASSWVNGPEGCLSGNVHSDFQRGRCQEFWSKQAQATVLAFAPLAILLVAYFIGMDSLGVTYRRVRKKIENRKAIAKGVVTNPAVASNDFYGWLYGFRPVSVDVGKGRQIRVYFPLEGQLPLPGDPIAVYTCGKAFGRHRFFGVFYAPHVVVL